MPDTYGRRPSAEELLHDLTRLLVLDGVEMKVPGRTPFERVQGPMERIYGAVQEYHDSEDFEPSLTQHAADEFELLSHQEKAARLAVQEMLGDLYDLPADSERVRSFFANIQLWGERLVAMRVKQSREDRQARLNDAIEAVS